MIDLRQVDDISEETRTKYMSQLAQSLQAEYYYPADGTIVRQLLPQDIGRKDWTIWDVVGGGGFSFTVNPYQALALYGIEVNLKDESFYVMHMRILTGKGVVAEINTQALYLPTRRIRKGNDDFWVYCPKAYFTEPIILKPLEHCQITLSGPTHPGIFILLGLVAEPNGHTVVAEPSLSPENIKTGATVFGVVGESLDQVPLLKA